jgi:hypothetical protein
MHSPSRHRFPILTTCSAVFGVSLLLATAAEAADVKPAASRPPLPVVSPGAKVIEGPGFRIEKVQRGGAAGPRAATPAAVAGDKPLTQTFFCRAGDNLLMANITLTSQGAGVVAQRGCRLRIVDSQISTGGVALLVEAGAIVELQNSTLAGRAGSVEAAPNARLAALGASFAGPATLTGADFIDRGGNLWGNAP